jgi:XTP/dITP diphosphohydrolase
MSAHTILIASNNSHKVEEFRECFTQFGARDTRLITPRELGFDLDPDETGDTYLANARIKAKAFYELIQGRDLWVMADDSGLEVDALSGAPGIRSARYHRNAPNKDGCAALLQEMARVPENARTARFRAIIVLISPAGDEHIFEGICEGSIGFDRRGTGGFGFDPVFRISGDRRHMAELASDEKHRISHRGLAAQQVIAFLRARSFL